MPKKTEAQQEARNEQTSVDLATIKVDIGYIKNEVGEIKRKLEGEYVTKAEFEAKFEPIKKIVYGVVGTILTGVVVAILALVLRS